MIKLIALDMDGTLLTPQGELASPEIQAIRRAQRAGLRLCLLTGRCAGDASRFLYEAGLSLPVLALSGTYCLDAPFGRVLSDEAIAPRALSSLTSILDRMDVPYLLFAGEMAAAVRDDGALAFFITHHQEQKEGIGPAALSAAVVRGVNKAAAIFDSAPEKRALIERMARGIPEIYVTSSGENNLEFQPSGADKGSALLRWASRFDILPDEIAAIGDSPNDLKMLWAAGLPIAMGNAPLEVKRCAKRVALPNSLHGAALAVEQIILSAAQNHAE